MKLDLRLISEYQIWGDKKIFHVIKEMSDENYFKEFDGLTGSIHAKLAHIVSIQDFFVKIMEGTPYDAFPDFTHLSKDDILVMAENLSGKWMGLVNSTKSETYPLALANNQRVNVEHIFVDAVMHSVQHRAQIQSFIRLLGYGKEELHPKDANLDYFNYLFTERKSEFILPAKNE